MKNMKLTLLFAFCSISAAVNAQVNPDNHRVEGYVRSNGTYVNSHMRTNPNNTIRDNYSTYPNTNPYTGRTGTVRESSSIYSNSRSNSQMYTPSRSSNNTNRTRTYPYSSY